MNELKRLLTEFSVNYTEVKYESGINPFEQVYILLLLVVLYEYFFYVCLRIINPGYMY